MKVLLGILAVFIIGGVVALQDEPSQAPALKQAQTVKAYPEKIPTFTSEQEELLRLTNEQRVAYGLGKLALNAELDRSAEAKCNDMEVNNYWDHGDWESFMTVDATKMGENLAKGYENNAQVVQGWMNSPTHRDNLLDSQFITVGFATCDGPQHNLVVQHFASL